MNLVVNIQEGLPVPVIGHRVRDAFRYQPKVEGLVPSTHAGVLKSEVDVPNVDAKVLDDDIVDTCQVA